MWKSRKFRAALALVIGSVAAALSGEITWATCITTSTAAVVAYIVGVAVEDAGAKIGAGK